MTVRGQPCGREVRRQGRLVLAYLALERPRAVARDELALAVWGEDAPGNHAAGLSSILSRLRRTLGEDAIESCGPASVRLAPDVEVDYHRALGWLEAAERDLRESRPESARAAASRAVAVLDRELLTGESEAWLEERQRSIAALAVRGRECVAEAALLCGGPQLREALDSAREVVRSEPYRESAHALLMRAWVAQGDVAEALKVYEELRVRLRTELGAVPGAGLRGLHDELLRSGHLVAPSHAEAPAVAVAAPPSPSGASQKF